MTQKNRRSSRGAPPAPPLEVTISDLHEEGYGLARHGRRELRVAGAFPGERVRVAVEHEGQQRVIGRLLKVLEPSADRVASPCTRAGACLGCPLIALAYPAQLRFKEERIRSALRAHPSLGDLEPRPAWEAPHPLGYRTSAKLVFGRDRSGIRIGLYRRGTHQVVDIGGCPIHHPLINRVVEVVREEVERQGVWIYDPVRGSGLLRYLLVRVSPAHQRAMVTFVTAQRNFREIGHLAKWLQRKVPEVISVHENVNPSSGNVILGRETRRVAGTPDLIDRVGETALRLSPGSFLQVNHDQAARIYGLARRWAGLTPGETALDLYCGIGGIALGLARDAGRVLGIEVNPEAVRNARENARLNGLDNCQFRDGDAAEILDDLAPTLPPGSVIAINPPRKGCPPELLEQVAGLEPRRILYVSCEPETLARDLDRLASLGLAAAELQPVDMFPQTPHIETVVRIEPDGAAKARSRRRPPRPASRT